MANHTMIYSQVSGHQIMGRGAEKSRPIKTLQLQYTDTCSDALPVTTHKCLLYYTEKMIYSDTGSSLHFALYDR